MKPPIEPNHYLMWTAMALFIIGYGSLMLEGNFFAAIIACMSLFTVECAYNYGVPT